MKWPGHEATTYFHLVEMLGIQGCIPPLSHTASQCSASLSIPISSDGQQDISWDRAYEHTELTRHVTA